MSTPEPKEVVRRLALLLALLLCGCAPRHVREARPTPIWAEGGKSCNAPGWHYDYDTQRCERSK